MIGVPVPWAEMKPTSSGARAGVGERGAHRDQRAGAELVGLDHVEGVVGGAVADDPAEHRRAAGSRVLLALEDQHAGALAHHEAVAAGVEGARDAVARERTHAPEGGDAQRRQRGLGAAGDDDVGGAALDHPHPFADRVGAGRAGRGDAESGPVNAEPDRDCAGGRVGHHHRDEVRRDAALAAGEERLALLLQGDQAADAGAEDHRDAVGVAVGERSLGRRLVGGRDAELGVAVGATRDARIHVALGVEGARYR